MANIVRRVLGHGQEISPERAHQKAGAVSRAPLLSVHPALLAVSL